MYPFALVALGLLGAAPPAASSRDEILQTARHPGLRWPDLADVAPVLRELNAAEADGLFWYAGETPEPALAGALDALARRRSADWIPPTTTRPAPRADPTARSTTSR